MKHQLVILVCCALASCNISKKIAYMQDIAGTSTDQTDVNPGIVIQPKDILSIVVSSRNPELAVVFNLPLLTYQAGSETMNYLQKQLGYTVDMDGNIDFPILGKLKVAGLTRVQLADMIKQKLIGEDLLKDPVITTEFLNFRVSVLGEVRLPGIFTVNDDRITILEALSQAGDLTIYGKRDNVLVRREKDGVTSFHRVDLRSGELFHSPVYYLQQNDVVYVEPNKVMAGRSRINENRTLGLWLSLASLLTSLAVLFVK